jgi:transposase
MSDADAVRRLPTIALLLEGSSLEAAARATGMDRQTLRGWVHRYNAQGPSGLSDRKAPGRTPLLTPEQVRPAR